MARILLKPGEMIEISPADSDGVITVTYGVDALTIHADMPDSSGREGLIYEEKFGLPPLSDPRWEPAPGREHDYDSIIERSQDPRLPEL